VNSKRQNCSLRISPQFMNGPVVSPKKELIAFRLYYQNEGELFSLLQQKINLYLLKQRRSEEKNWKLSLQKEEYSIRSLIHFMLDQNISTREEVLEQIKQMQLKMRSLYAKMIQ
jgi:hypothetical protein